MSAWFRPPRVTASSSAASIAASPSPLEFDTVVDTRLCTVIADAALPDVRVGTIEHLMAALSATGIDNLVVEVDGAELPVLDGSAEPWMFLLECAGVAIQTAPRQVVEVLRVVRVEDGDAFVELRPNIDGLDLALSIEFELGGDRSPGAHVGARD